MSLGVAEIILIVIAILVLFGGDKLPELARGVGRGLAEFRRATKRLKQEIQSSIEVSPASPKTVWKAGPSNSTPTQTVSKSLNDSENPSSQASEKPS
jgi:sec-independent protein translocase protein TatA